MHILELIKTKLVNLVTEPRWHTIGIFFVGYLLIGGLGYWALDEKAIVADVPTFLYYSIVTGSTVGYGDLSPVTTGGKLFTALWVIIVGIILLGYVMGKAASDIAHIVSKRKRGEHQSMKVNHIVVVGYGPETETLVTRLIEETEGKIGIVVCADKRGPETDPFPFDLVEYIRGESFSSYEIFRRAAVERADSVIIDVKEEVAMVCMLLTSMVDETCRVTAYVGNQTEGDMLEMYCPNVNVIPDLSQQIMVKASTDPGSEELIRSLVHSSVGQTQYCLEIEDDPNIPRNITASMMSKLLRRHFEAIFVAVRNRDVDGETPRVNPPSDTIIRSGERIYYIADERIDPEEFMSARKEEFV